MRLRLALGSALGWALAPVLAAAEPLDVFDPTPRPIRIEFEISASPGTIGQTWSAPFEATYTASGNTGTVVVSAAAYASAIATQQLDYVSALAAWTLVPGSATELRLAIDLTTLQATAQPAHYGVSLAISPPQDGVVTRNLSTTTVAGFAFLPQPAGFPFYCVPCVPVPGAPYDPATGRLNAIGSDHLVSPDVDVNGFSRAGDLRLSEAPIAVPALSAYGLLALAALLTLVGVRSPGISRRIPKVGTRPYNAPTMKILVCDDHALFREGVVHALRELERGAEVVEAADGAQALELAGQHADLDLVLLDLHMPGTDGWTGLARLQQACPTLPIVILSASEDPADARRAIEAGAAGFVTKSTRGPVLRAALSLVLSGGVYLPPHVLVHEAASVSPGAASGAKSRRAAESLTERQLEVLRLMSRGLTNAEIGEVLGVAIGTVKTHIGAIFEALDVSNRTEAALVMRDLGLDQER